LCLRAFVANILNLFNNELFTSHEVTKTLSQRLMRLWCKRNT
jgi:hypothetical protein